MSHFLTFITNSNGVVSDTNLPNEIELIMSPTFGFSDVNLYSHGWWNDASAALNCYNRFSIEFAAHLKRAANSRWPSSSLNVGIHWPSMLSEDSNLLNCLQAASFFTMEKRADDVGETGVFALLSAMIRQRQNVDFRINLIGHSFGCKVICAALQRLAETKLLCLDRVSFNVVLLQAAFDHDDFNAGEMYGELLSLPRCRMLVTKSSEDGALGTMFPLAHKLEFFNRHEGKIAMGFAGPSNAAVNLVVNPDASFDALNAKLICADLSPLHRAHPENHISIIGHHSDIYHEEIYDLIARFLY